MPYTLRLYLTDEQAAAVDVMPGTVAYLKSYDLDAGMEGWGGACELTLDPAQAVRWPTVSDAFKAWAEQSKAHPFRPYDGEPNKPLTAYTCDIMDVP